MFRPFTLAMIVVLVVLAALGFALWRGAPSNSVVAVSTPQVGCAQPEVDQFVQELDRLMAEWTDAVDLADSTSRIALSPAVDKLQAIRRTAETLPVPACGEYLRQMVVVWMNFGIDGYLTLMRQSGAPDAYENMRDFQLPYALAEADLRDEIARFRAAPLDTYRAGNQAEAWAACCLPGWWHLVLPFGGASRVSLPETWLNVPARSDDEIKFTSADGEIVGTLQATGLQTVSIAPRTTAFVAENFSLDDIEAETRYGRAGETVVFAQIVPYRVTAHVQVTPEIAYIVTAETSGNELTPEDVDTLLKIAASVRLD